MSFLAALLLGIAAGLTVFLPLSSSAVGEMLSALLSVHELPVLFLMALLHGAAYLAAAVLMRKRLRVLFRALFAAMADICRNAVLFFRYLRTGGQPDYRRVCSGAARNMAVCQLVMAVISLPLSFFLRRIAARTSAFGILGCIGFYLTAILLLVGYLTQKGRRTREIRPRGALFLGLLEGIAVFPGISRLGIVYAGGILMGMSRRQAGLSAILAGFPSALFSVIYYLRISSGLTSWGSGAAATAIGGSIGAFCFAALFLKASLVILKKDRVILFAVLNAALGTAAALGYILH